MRNTTTRYLLTCAAIGVACGVLLVPANNLAVALGTSLPFLYGAIVGVWLLPPALALALIRRPSAGVLTAAMAGLVASPVNPTGPAALLTSVAVGLLFEAPFAIGRYRNWSWWMFQISALAIAGLFIPTVWAFYDLGSWNLLAAATLLLMVIASCSAFTWIATVLSARVAATGVVRGLAPSAIALHPPIPETQEP